MQAQQPFPGGQPGEPFRPPPQQPGYQQQHDGQPPMGAPVPSPQAYRQAPPPQRPVSFPTDSRLTTAAILVVVNYVLVCIPVGLIGMWMGLKVRKAAIERGEPSNSTNSTGGLLTAIFGGMVGGLSALFWLVNLVYLLLTGSAVLLAILASAFSV